MIKKKPDILVAILIGFVLINSIYISAITGSMGNARMILYPEVNGWFTTTIEKSILVKNVNDVPINITLTADKEGEEFLEVLDDNFILQPNTEKKAEFLVKVKKEGTYEGRINVFFSPIDSKEPGVVLSSTIIVIAKKDIDYQEDEEENEVEIITGDVSDEINEEDKISKGIIFLGISSFVLLIVLAYLIFVMIKRETKKGGKLNAKKKS